MSENGIERGQLTRFTRGHICPICGGSDGDPRSQGKRCHGFVRGNWAYCSREEHSGDQKFHPSSQTYPHRIKGKCPCGVEHAPGDRPARPEIAHIYKYLDKEGNPLFEVVRYRNPKGFRQRRPIEGGKYAWNLHGVEPVLYQLPALAAADSSVPVWIVEGEKDADRLASLGLLATCNAMGAGKWRESYSLALDGRTCCIIADNDEPGRLHAQAVARSLWGKADSIKIVELPDLPDHGDVSDWLVRGTLDQLLSLADETPEWAPAPEEEQPDGRNGEYSGPAFANFKARIVREIIRHENVENTRHVEIEAKHADGTVARATIKAEEFESMNWVTSQLGMKFVIDVGRGRKEQFQHFIRIDSYFKGVELRHIFTSLGWHELDGKDVYLHAGGGINADGAAAVEVDVSAELAMCRLPNPDARRLKEAVAKVLAIGPNLGKGAETVAAIVAALPFRAILGPSRTVPHFSGTTGTLKTSTACLAARFFAPELEYSDSMPLSWSSTAAGLERLRHMAKDSLVVIDNLIVDGEGAGRENWKADWVFNSQGDLTGRGRMRADGTTAPRIDPRGCIISTGECDPRRRSAAGRSVIVEFRPGLIDLEGLKRCHEDARQGWYAITIACYAQHLAHRGNLEAGRAELKRLALEHQADAMAHCKGCHPRHAEAVAEWTAGWQLFLTFAVAAGAINQREAADALDRVRKPLFDSLEAQAEIQEENDPGEIFLDLLQSLLASKRAALVGMDGMAPEPEIAGACGWNRVEITQRGGDLVPVWDLASGAARIGWVDEEMVYLDPNTSHAAVERLARELGRAVGTPRQVWTRLAETKRIELEEQTDKGRRYFTRKVTVEKHRPRCIWLPRKWLIDTKVSAHRETKPEVTARNSSPY